MRATCSWEIMLHLPKGIDPPPPAAADSTHNPAGRSGCAPGEPLGLGSRWRRLQSRRRGEIGTSRRTRLRLICHAILPALTVLALTSAMILQSLQAQTLFITA